MKCTHPISISEIATAGILFLIVSATKALPKLWSAKQKLGMIMEIQNLLLE
jgi:hypothetical protein